MHWTCVPQKVLQVAGFVAKEKSHKTWLTLKSTNQMKGQQQAASDLGVKNI